MEWVRLSGLPSNALERNIRALRVSRYRAAMQAANEARSDDVVISHHPLMSNAVSIALRLMKRRARHIAWAFNFTQLPSGSRLEIISKALSNVEKFIVFSRYEKDLYAEHLGIDKEKFTNVLWTQNAPTIDNEFEPMIKRPFVCAVGGEGRDIDLVIKAAERFKKVLDFVIITRPHIIESVAIPDNVRILTNLPAPKTWAIANESVGVLIPLVSDDTCCGHITIVSAKLLGLPIVTTRSVATEEYVVGRQSILCSVAGDLDDFCGKIEALFNDREALKVFARAARQQEADLHSRAVWSDVLNSTIFDVKSSLPV